MQVVFENEEKKQQRAACTHAATFVWAPRHAQCTSACAFINVCWCMHRYVCRCVSIFFSCAFQFNGSALQHTEQMSFALLCVRDALSRSSAYMYLIHHNWFISLGCIFWYAIIWRAFIHWHGVHWQNAHISIEKQKTIENPLSDSNLWWVAISKSPKTKLNVMCATRPTYLKHPFHACCGFQSIN